MIGHLDPATVHDDDARVESYNVTGSTPTDHRITWHSTVWHPGLPYAVSALARRPSTSHTSALCRAVQTIVDAQLDDGRWPSTDGAATLSVWTIWPYIEALADVRFRSPVASGGLLTVVAPDAIILRTGAARERGVFRTVWRPLPRRGLAGIRRRWAAFVLALFTIGGVWLALLGMIRWREFGLGMVVPIILLLIQIGLPHTRPER
ncbi:MAG: hypothetical protein HKP61_07770 [Dactylosporangium sp.]|nr:hypothetical protein [Dactylosporangium sp.]NNJ60834.1 hypothetical protein [Dactylosporangium sp.]